MQKRSWLALGLALIALNLHAQQPVKPNAAEIYAQIQKLNVLGSVLYIAAHPDDENTRLISYLANEKKFRTGYLSLTRGDGGQNLIGPELRELLGTIRTQELLEARKIDGGEQFFSRANDFGFSKNPEETLNIWDKSQVLADLVWQIRKFRPDVIIDRFDHRTPGTTHGHHTSSALLSVEGFDLANDQHSFPEQLQNAQPWQPKRLFFNTSWWFYGSKEKFDQADKSNMYQLPVGVYFPLIGKSNPEIAALSRSRHRSQGFGSTGTRGEELEYLEFIKGQKPANTDLFEGIDTSWKRVAGGALIGDFLAQVIQQYDFRNPSASIPGLVKAYQMIDLLQEDYWKPLKQAEIRKIIAGCAGLYCEAVTTVPQSTPGSSVKVKVEVTNRSEVPMTLETIQWMPENRSEAVNQTLKNNVPFTVESDLVIARNAAYTQPYWLDKPGTVGMYRVDNPMDIGKPDVIRDLKAVFQLNVNGITLPFETNVVYKYNDDVKGEIFSPFDIVPDVSVAIQDKVLLFADKKSKVLKVKVKSMKAGASGKLQLELPANWTAKPGSVSFGPMPINDEQTFDFEVFPTAQASEGVVSAKALVDGIWFDREQISINYDHIARQQVLRPAQTRVIRSDIRTGKEKIAYIMGAGDEVPKSLGQLGYSVSVLKPEEITAERLAAFDVVMTGVRSYNVVTALAQKQPLLLDFVKQGKTMIVQYNTTDDLVTPNIAPYPLKISRDRVTEENAEVQFLDPKALALNSPNKITAHDFEGWKQEQGLYYPNQWDPAFSPLLSAHDKGEPARNGALLVCQYGKGHYVYTGLSFFRELPEGVCGAYRLMANLISLK